MNDLKNKIIAVLVGISFMLIALLIQIIFQEMPFIILFIEHGYLNAEKILENFEFSYAILYAIFIGGTAGIFQELMKYFGVKIQNIEYALYVGIGFSIIDISVGIIEYLPTKLVYYEYIILAVNFLISLMFHPGTAMLLKHGIIINKIGLYLPLTILLHTFIDGGVAFSDIVINKNNFVFVVTTFLTISVIISLLSLIFGLKLNYKDQKGYKNQFVNDNHD
ncbi:MAG: hypothetical protein ACP5F1_06635 [Thermoplasmata archaeon]|nr:hypothetical protein [Thermoplasmata archaeon]